MLEPRDPEVSVETTQGDRPRASAGDRLLIGLAVLALAGGALIALSKILPSPEAVASASPRTSASPSVAVSPSDGALPLRTLRLSGDSPPVAAPAFGGQGGWARALQRVRVLEGRGRSANEVGVLQPGDAMYVARHDERLASRWLEVIAPLHGWIDTETPGGPRIRRFATHRLDRRIVPDAVFAGARGEFVFGGMDSYALTYVLGATSGGQAWERTDPPRGTEFVRAAYGPHRWVALTISNLTTGMRAWAWQSDDGLGWASLGDLSSLIPQDGLGDIDLAGSSRGYVMSPFHSGGGRTPPRVLFSADGVTWSERATPIGPDRVVASEVGFYGYSTNASERPVAAFSPDGDRWDAVDTSEMAGLIGVAATTDGFVALDRVGGLVRAWTARVEQGRLAWRRDPLASEAFAGSVLTSLSGGTAAIATGWARDSETPLWWSLGPAGWQRHELPPSFGGLPRVAAASTDGYVIVGTGAGSLHQNPILWKSTGSSELQPERRPFLGGGASLGPASCAHYSGDLLDMMMNSGLAYAECRGNAPIAFRGYVVLCQGCGPVTPAEPNQASWLAQPDPRRTLRLAPIHTSDLGSLETVLAPGIAVRSAWANQWVNVVGHFDDPAAESCRIAPATFDEVGYPGRDEIIRECRARFVVTEVRLDPQP
ncbi:MAG TPA: hypothetical protein VIA82_09780 [Candidatus Limnocylindria bacterium]